VELKAYLAVIRRRVWVIALVVVIAALLSGYEIYSSHTTSKLALTYTSAITLRVGLQAGGPTAAQNPEYDTTTSENLANQFATGPVLSSSEFDTQVTQQIAQDMSTIKQQFGTNPDLGNWQDTAMIASSLKVTQVQSLVTIEVDWHTAAGAWAIAHAIGEVSQAHISHYVDYVVRDQNSGATTAQPPAAAQVVSPASIPSESTTSKASRLLILMLIIIVGFIIGLALAFLMEYLDDRLRTQAEVEQLLQLPVYGEIPQAPTPNRSR
jgi:capsular polysaccharide biosynthesis protein